MNSNLYGFNQPNYPQTPITYPYYNNFQNYINLPKMEVIRVNGKNGVDAFQMGANSSVILLDTTNPLVWFVQTDGAGYKTSTPYKIEPYVEAVVADNNSLEARVKRIEDMLNGKSDCRSNEQNATANANTIPVTATNTAN